MLEYSSPSYYIEHLNYFWGWLGVETFQDTYQECLVGCGMLLKNVGCNMQVPYTYSYKSHTYSRADIQINWEYGQAQDTPSPRIYRWTFLVLTE